MKLLSILLALIFACSSARAQAPYELDVDAEAYCTANQITDPYNVQRIHQFISGLKGLNLWSSLVMGSTFRRGYTIPNIHNSSLPPAIVGTKWSVIDKVPMGQDGYLFDGTMTQYLEVDNPIQGTAVTEYSIMIPFQSASLAPTYCLFSGSDYANNLRGPAIYLNGCKDDQDTEYGSIYQYYANSGSADPASWPSSSSPLFKMFDCNTGGPQLVLMTYGNTSRSLYGPMNSVVGTSGALGTAANNSTKWRLGRDFDAPAPLPFGFQGVIAGIFVWNKQLTKSEAAVVRYLYERTIGEGFMSKVKLLFDTDSTFNEGANSRFTWHHHLGTNQVWSYVDRRPSLFGVSTLDLSYAMLAQYTVENVRDLRYAQRIYYMPALGFNDMLLTGLSVDDTVEKLFRMYRLARSKGMKVVAFTLPWTFRPLISPYNKNDAETYAKWKAFNTKIKASNGEYDYLVELDKIPELKVDNFNEINSRPGYWTTQGFLSTEANRLIAEKIATTIGNPLR